MKRKTTQDEISPGCASLVLWRRFGRGFWFVVQTASLASDRRNQSLVRTLRAESVLGNPYWGRTGHRPAPCGDSPTGTGESPVLPIFKTRSDRFSYPSLQSVIP